MTITLPRLRFLAPLFAASVFCASALGGYFSSGSAGVLTACFLLFLLTAAVRPTRREWGGSQQATGRMPFCRAIAAISAARVRMVSSPMGCAPSASSRFLLRA